MSKAVTSLKTHEGLAPVRLTVREKEEAWTFNDSGGLHVVNCLSDLGIHDAIYLPAPQASINESCPSAQAFEGAFQPVVSTLRPSGKASVLPSHLIAQTS